MFYAIPEMHTRDGMPVNAIFGVAKFLKSLSEENPQAHIVIATDVWPSFREEIFTEYKGTRDRMPDNLRSQIDGVFSLFRAAGIPMIGKEGYEADDIIGSLATTCARDERMIVIISSDKDLCQFVVDDCVHIYDAMKRKFMRRADVIEKFGVPPEQVRDYLAIVGDSSDNIPGIAGFGPKKTADLLGKFGSLEGIYAHLDECTPKMRELLEAGRELALLSQQLATIRTDVAFDLPDSEVISFALMKEEYIQALRSYEFRSLIPSSYAVESPKSVISVETLDSHSALSEALATWKSSEVYVGIAVDGLQKIAISSWGVVYEVDHKKVDATELIDAVLVWEIRIAAYDAKGLFRELLLIKNPPKLPTAQESLF